MNRFLRVAFIISFISTFAIVVVSAASGVGFPLISYVFLFLGVFCHMFPIIMPSAAKYNALLKIGGILIAALGALFLLKMPIAFLIVHAVLTVLSFVLANLLNYNTIHRDFETKFKASCIVGLLLYAIFFIIGTQGFVGLLDGESVVAGVVQSLPCMVITLAMGILLLRGLRASTGIVNEKAFNIRQIKETLLFFASCILFFMLDVPRLIRLGFEWLFREVITPIVNFIARMLGILIDLITVRDTTTAAPIDITPGPTTSVDLTPPPSGEPIPQPADVFDNSSDLMKTIVFIIIAILVAVVIWIVVKKIIKRGGKGASMGYPNEEREDLPPDEEKKAKNRLSRFDRDPRTRIRFLYREFMKYLRSLSIPVKKHDTCGSIGDRASAIMPEKDEKIRELSDIYRGARYDSETNPTVDEAKRAKELYDEIKTKRNSDS